MRKSKRGYEQGLKYLTSEYFQDFTNVPPPKFGIQPVHFVNRVNDKDYDHIDDVFEK
jgi:hypothetical protein